MNLEKYTFEEYRFYHKSITDFRNWYKILKNDSLLNPFVKYNF